jgi:hypothetical protein
MIQNVRHLLRPVTESTENTEDYLLGSLLSLSSSVISVFSVTQAQELVERYTPQDVKEVNRSLFDYARALRAAFPVSNMAELVPYVELWHKVASANVKGLDWGEVWCDFLFKWNSVKFPVGEDVFTCIMQEINEYEPPACSTFLGGPVGKLVHIIQRLQIHVGDNPFYLASRKAGVLMGVDHNRAAKWLKSLVYSGTLEVVTKHTSYKATRYRYLGDTP